jgi:hypothetical protein
MHGRLLRRVDQSLALDAVALLFVGCERGSARQLDLVLCFGLFGGGGGAFVPFGPPVVFAERVIAELAGKWQKRLDVAVFVVAVGADLLDVADGHVFGAGDGRCVLRIYVLDV